MKEKTCSWITVDSILRAVSICCFQNCSPLKIFKYGGNKGHYTSIAENAKDRIQNR